MIKLYQVIYYTPNGVASSEPLPYEQAIQFKHEMTDNYNYNAFVQRYFTGGNNNE